MFVAVGTQAKPSDFVLEIRIVVGIAFVEIVIDFGGAGGYQFGNYIVDIDVEDAGFEFGHKVSL